MLELLAACTGSQPFGIDLAEWKEIARGGQRVVYEHPKIDSFLIKVTRPESIKSEGRMFSGPWWKRMRPLGCHTNLIREFTEIIKLQGSDLLASDQYPPVARLYGWIPTSIGPGVIVERIACSDGKIAPTLRELIARNLISDQHLKALRNFFDCCRQTNCVLHDIHFANLVYTDCRGGKRLQDQDAEIVCIDGFGDNGLIPLKLWVRKWNRKQLDRYQKIKENQLQSKLERPIAA